MNCWEILGIEPTGDRRKIQDAYEQQLKFASEDEARSLEQAFREAVGDAPAPVMRTENAIQPEQPAQAPDEAAERPLDANDGQVVREVVIQIKALLNDSSRSKDPGIWKAILDEPPADQPRLRREIGRQLFDAVLCGDVQWFGRVRSHRTINRETMAFLKMLQGLFQTFTEFRRFLVTQALIATRGKVGA